jgi:ribonucleoside-diphosphate reductase alpha chain
MMFDVDETPELLRQIDNAGGKLTAIPSLPEGLKKIAKTANEIDPQWHLNMQAELQNYVENNISKTIALPADTSFPFYKVDQLIGFAHDSGVRGLTVYVDGSREGQVIMAEEKCPVCGSSIVKEEGCKKCVQCGWSTCSV